MGQKSSKKVKKGSQVKSEALIRHGTVKPTAGHANDIIHAADIGAGEDADTTYEPYDGFWDEAADPHATGSPIRAGDKDNAKVRFIPGTPIKEDGRHRSEVKRAEALKAALDELAETVFQPQLETRANEAVTSAINSKKMYNHPALDEFFTRDEFLQLVKEHFPQKSAADVAELVKYLTGPLTEAYSVFTRDLLLKKTGRPAPESVN